MILGKMQIPKIEEPSFLELEHSIYVGTEVVSFEMDRNGYGIYLLYGSGLIESCSINPKWTITNLSFCGATYTQLSDPVGLALGESIYDWKMLITTWYSEYYDSEVMSGFAGMNWNYDNAPAAFYGPFPKGSLRWTNIFQGGYGLYINDGWGNLYMYGTSEVYHVPDLIHYETKQLSLQGVSFSRAFCTDSYDEYYYLSTTNGYIYKTNNLSDINQERAYVGENLLDMKVNYYYPFEGPPEVNRLFTLSDTGYLRQYKFL